MSVGGYHKIERNDFDLNTEKIEKIANILDIKPCDLINADAKHVFSFSNNKINNGGYNVVNFPDEVKELQKSPLSYNRQILFGF